MLGPGYGESVVLHVGAGEWVVVDSCAHPETREPAALEYLRSLGVDLTQDVRLVVATHWHDDHIRGLAEVVRRCSGADFACSLAFTKPEFLTLVKAYDSTDSSSGVQEFGSILDLLSEESDRQQRVSRLAIANRVLLRRNSPGAVTVTALSPSDRAVTKGLKAAGQLLPEPLRPKRRVASPSRNDASVALWVDTGGQQVLLGADLETTSRDDMGWSAVVASRDRPAGVASVFKVPHHGSSNGDHPEVWANLLEQPIAALTPYEGSNVSLPTEEDQARIRSHASAAYLAGQGSRRPQRHTPSVERTLRETTVRRRRQGRLGHVRLRTNAAGGLWAVQLFGSVTTL